MVYGGVLVMHLLASVDGLPSNVEGNVLVLDHVPAEEKSQMKSLRE